jgi:ppGpp synthetase/RelA/SpoT-type nucleotidyltranferase
MMPRRPSVLLMGPATTAQTLGYSEFGDWYDRYRSEVLEPALASASDALDAVLTDVLSDRDLARIHNPLGRVKSKRRTWRKLRQPHYQDRIDSTSDIAKVVDDLVGLRVTCTNLRDIDMVQAALEGLPRRAGRSLWLDASSERDYVLEPKESGYRGWHVNLGVTVVAGKKRTPVTCELQVRTLIQDSWGELTHEDTYSKDGELPPLVEVLSKRMADLFSTLDDIAEDLRTELDRIDEAAVTGPDDSGTPDDQEGAGSDQAADAAAILLERWQTLDRPTELATMAWALQREFGAEISDDWFDYRSFKRFLRHAVPDGEISTGRQAYLLPPGYAPDEGADDDDATPSTIPAVARQLRRVDRGFPLLESDQWHHLYTQLATAWQRLGPREPTTRVLNQLTRSARDRAEAAGTAVSRRHFDYVAKAVLSADNAGRPLDAAGIAEAFTTVTLQRMTDLRILGGRNRKARAAVRRWLSPT